MSGEDLNSISVLGHDVLLVDVGGGAETHLASTADSLSARAALADDGSSPKHSGSVDADEETLLVRRWSRSTLCGREWTQMAAGEGGPRRRWQEISLAPTCRSCLRVVDAWFPTTETPAGVGLLAWVVAEAVEELGSAYITGVPAEHIEAVRRAARTHLRERGFRSQTSVVNSVVLVSSDDAYQAIDPALRKRWIDDAVARIDANAEPDAVHTRSTVEAIDWHTWVVDI